MERARRRSERGRERGNKPCKGVQEARRKATRSRRFNASLVSTPISLPKIIVFVRGSL